MSRLAINTTQNVNIDFRTASLGERILAFLIDMLLKIVYIYFLYYLVNKFYPNYIFDNKKEIVIITLFSTPVLLYSLIFESIFSGQTPGKLIMQIKVIKIEGFEASFADYFNRWLLRFIDILMLTGMIGSLFIALSDKHQRLGDMLAGTTVISVKKRHKIEHTILQETADNYVAKYPQAIYLSDKDARIIKNSLNRAKKDPALLRKLTNKIEETLKIQNQEKTDLAFIERILKDFNQLTREF